MKNKKLRVKHERLKTKLSATRSVLNYTNTAYEKLITMLEELRAANENNLLCIYDLNNQLKKLKTKK